jgi:cephalosporin hydroxylase
MIKRMAKAVLTFARRSKRLVAPLPNPKVKDAEYSAKYNMTVAEWMIYHQEQLIHQHRPHWMGVTTLKNPLDCWIYQEILWEIKPEVLVEIGSFAGGSSLFFCSLFDGLGQGEVLSVDLDRTHFQAKHPRLVEVTGDCSDPAVVSQVAARCVGKKVLVIHDGDHLKKAVLRDLRLYAGFVSVGSYFIVEDGVVDVFNPDETALGWNRAGPLAATREFLKENDQFVIDEERERYLITYSPRGFLKRVK